LAHYAIQATGSPIHDLSSIHAPMEIVLQPRVGQPVTGVPETTEIRKTIPTGVRLLQLLVAFRF